jgi:peroxiredoxin (alkyl hydroperoxide reductase subunit C)
MSLVGTTVQPFKATTYHNGKFVDITEADLKGKWSAFVFYPADFTFVCPTELGDLADMYGEFQKIGCEIYSISTDTHFVHKGWADASDTIRKIKYPMIGDPTGAITRNFDVMIEEFGLEFPALAKLATIVRGADTARLDIRPEAAGLLAVSLGLSRMYGNDLEQLDAGMLIYDAFYRWSRDASDETHSWPGTGGRK